MPENLNDCLLLHHFYSFRHLFMSPFYSSFLLFDAYCKRIAFQCTREARDTVCKARTGFWSDHHVCCCNVRSILTMEDRSTPSGIEYQPIMAQCFIPPEKLNFQLPYSPLFNFICKQNISCSGYLILTYTYTLIYRS